jgi:hypothetical protein
VSPCFRAFLCLFVAIPEFGFQFELLTQVFRPLDRDIPRQRRYT